MPSKGRWQTNHMKYSFSGEFSQPTATVSEILEVLGSKILATGRGDYTAYISHVDALYPITGFNMDIIEPDTCSFSSTETYGGFDGEYHAKKLYDEISGFPDTLRQNIYAESADNIDQSLDMQLDEACSIVSWAVDDVCQSLYFITGCPMDYC